MLWWCCGLKGKSIKVSYSGNGGSNRLCFKNKDYEKIVEFLNKNLSNSSITIDLWLGKIISHLFKELENESVSLVL